MSARVAFSTFPSPAAAAAAAHTAVDESLAACVNIVPAIRSIYRWDDEIKDEDEVLAIFKTSASQVEALTKRLVEIHPYDCPEVVVLDVTSGHPDYLAWIESRVGAGAGDSD